MKKIFFNILFLHLSVFAYSQMYEVTLKQRAQEAKYIFEGNIITKGKSYLATDSNVYTSYVFEIKKILKAEKNFCCQKVEIITEGGSVGNFVVTHSEGSFSFGIGGPFILFCDTSRFPFNPDNRTLKHMEIYAGVQGIIGFKSKSNQDLDEPPASDIYNKYYDIPGLYKTILKMAGNKRMKICK